MRVLCSHCHTAFEVAAEEEHKFCPNCKAEAGLEPIREGTPKPMRLFGAVLLVLVVLVVGGSLIGLLP
ncbi:MAG: hypothetical protein R6X02_00860 [Enhygromyxa sp.]